MSILGNRIKQLREELNMTQAGLSQALNEKYELRTDRVMISKWETGYQTPVMHTITCLAKMFNVSIDYLNGSDDKSARFLSNSPGIIPLPKTKKVPLLGDIACGNPIMAIRNSDEFIEIPDDINATFALKCKGDSMVNARIYNGDIVYIREQPEVENGEIAAVQIDNGDNEVTLKRIKISPDKLTLWPENQSYEPIVFVGDEINRVQIIGKAVAFISAVR